jgi:hypothetical protein
MAVSGYLLKRKGFWSPSEGDWTIDVMFDHVHNVAAFTAISSYRQANYFQSNIFGGGNTMGNGAYSGIMSYESLEGGADFSSEENKVTPAIIDNDVSEVTFRYGAMAEDGDSAFTQGDAIFFILFTE